MKDVRIILLVNEKNVELYEKLVKVKDEVGISMNKLVWDMLKYVIESKNMVYGGIKFVSKEVDKK